MGALFYNLETQDALPDFHEPAKVCIHLCYSTKGRKAASPGRCRCTVPPAQAPPVRHLHNEPRRTHAAAPHRGAQRRRNCGRRARSRHSQRRKPSCPSTWQRLRCTTAPMPRCPKRKMRWRRSTSEMRRRLAAVRRMSRRSKTRAPRRTSLTRTPRPRRCPPGRARALPVTPLSTRRDGLTRRCLRVSGGLMLALLYAKAELVQRLCHMCNIRQRGHHRCAHA